MADVTITPVSEGTFQVNVRTFEDITVDDIGGLEADLNLKADKANPTFTGTVSGITKDMVGLGNIDNTSDINKPVSTSQQNALNLKSNIASPTFTGTVTLPTTTNIGGVSSTEISYLNGLNSPAQNQIDQKAPLESPTFTGTITGITKSMVGLGSVDNTSDTEKPVSTLQQSALDLKINTSLKGAVNGVAELGSDGKVLSSQLPASVDTIQTYPSRPSFPITGSDNIIYVAEDTEVSYRWNGTGYTEISSSLALGSTSGTAHRGDHGASAYTHSQLTSGNPHNVTKIEILLGNVDNTSDVNKPISTATQTALNLKATTSTLNNKVQVIEIDPVYLSGVGDITEQIAEYIDANQLITSTLETSKINIKLGSASPESGSIYSNHSHSNKSLLDGIQESLTTVLKTSYDSVVAWISTNGANILAHLSSVANPHSVTKTQVGLGSVDNTSDASKPISTAQQTALDLKANLASPTFTGTVVLPSTTSIGGVTNTELSYLDATSPIQNQIDTKAPIANPTFTGIVSGITKSMVGLSDVDNTSDSSKPVSTPHQTALDLKADLDSPTFTGTVVLPATTSIGTITNTELSYIDGVTSSIQTQIDAKSPTDSPTFTGTVTGITKAMVGLENIDNTTDLLKPISTATQIALDLKADDSELIDTNVSQFGLDGLGDVVLITPYVAVTGNVISFNINNTMGTPEVPNTSVDIAPTVENAIIGNKVLVFSKASSQPSYTVGILKGDIYSFSPDAINVLVFTYYGDSAITVWNEVLTISTISEYSYYLNLMIAAYMMDTNTANVMADSHSVFPGDTVDITVGSDAEGSYYDYNGTSSIVTVDHDSAFSVTTEFTFMVDVYPDSTTGGTAYRAIFAKPRIGIASQHYSLLMTENNMSLLFRTRIGSSTRDWTISGGLMQANKWNRIIGKYKSGEAKKIWIKPIDSAVQALTEGVIYTGSMNSEITPLVFGNASAELAYQQGFFNGRMKKMHLWGTALSDADINLLITNNLSYPDFI